MSHKKILLYNLQWQSNLDYILELIFILNIVYLQTHFKGGDAILSRLAGNSKIRKLFLPIPCNLFLHQSYLQRPTPSQLA